MISAGIINKKRKLLQKFIIHCTRRAKVTDISQVYAENFFLLPVRSFFHNIFLIRGKL